MPRAFCTGTFCSLTSLSHLLYIYAFALYVLPAQPAILTVAWLFMTFVTSGMAVCSTTAILRPKGGVPATPMFV